MWRIEITVYYKHRVDHSNLFDKIHRMPNMYHILQITMFVIIIV